MSLLPTPSSDHDDDALPEMMIPPAIDLEASPVQGQLGSAVLDLNGQVVRQGGLFPPDDARILFRMLIEVGMLEPKAGFRRMTVAFPTGTYSVARDESHVFVVQTRPM